MVACGRRRHGGFGQGYPMLAQNGPRIAHLECACAPIAHLWTTFSAFGRISSRIDACPSAWVDPEFDGEFDQTDLLACAMRLVDIGHTQGKTFGSWLARLHFHPCECKFHVSRNVAVSVSHQAFWLEPAVTTTCELRFDWS